MKTTGLCKDCFKGMIFYSHHLVSHVHQAAKQETFCGVSMDISWNNTMVIKVPAVWIVLDHSSCQIKAKEIKDWWV